MEIKSGKYLVLSLVLLLVGLDVVMSATSTNVCNMLTESECEYMPSQCSWIISNSCYGGQIKFCGLKSCVSSNSNKTTCVQSPTDSSVFYTVPSTTCTPTGYKTVASSMCACPNPPPSQIVCANLEATANLTHSYDVNDCLFYKSTCYILTGTNCDNSTFAICRNKALTRCKTKKETCALEPQSRLIYKFDTACVPNNWEIISSSKCVCSK